MARGAGPGRAPRPLRSTVLHLCFSNSLERLAGELARCLAGRPDRSPPALLEPEVVVVPNRNVATYVRLQIARHNGIAANLAILHWEGLLTRILQPPGAGGPRLLTRRAVAAMLASLLGDPAEVARVGSPALTRYLDPPGTAPGDRSLHAFQLAGRLAAMFEEYQASRAELLAAWRQGLSTVGGHVQETEHWQRALWLRLAGPEGLRAAIDAKGPDRWVFPGEVVDAVGAPPSGLPARIQVFGFSYMPRGHLALLRRLADTIDVHVHDFIPVRPRVSPGSDQHLALTMWGRPGLEHAAMLLEMKPDRVDELFGPDRIAPAAAAPPARPTQAPAPPAAHRARPRGRRAAADGSVQLTLFGPDGEPSLDLATPATTPAPPPTPVSDPLPAPTLLDALRADLEHGTRPEKKPAVVRPAITVLACPGIQREVEVVAGMIWKVLEASDSGTGPRLRFNDIAIAVADPMNYGQYQSHIRAVFQDMYGIPTSVGDVAPASQGRVLEAIELLVSLPEGRFRRPELLRLLAHPALAARFGRTDAEDWKSWCERTAIFQGADLSDLSGLYVDKDVLSWDQGLKRLTLGAFLAGPQGGDPVPFELAGQRYVPEEVAPGELESAALLARLVRSLVAQARSSRQARLGLAGWSRHYTRLVSSYLAPTDPSDEAVFSLALRELGALASLDLTGRPIEARVAAEFAREALARIPGGRGHYLADGVIVSALQPMRPIPFPVLFIMGLGEGCFPSSEGLDAVDLRRAGRQPGDVTARERDQYLFLEAVVSTTRELFLSYVNRDARTGDPINRSSVIEELLRVVQESHAGEEGSPGLVQTHPLRRWEEDPAAGRVVVSPRARRERLLVEWPRPVPPGVPRRQRLELYRSAAEGARRWLGLLPLPVEASGRRIARVDLHVSAIRRFLECPLQGWARAVLRLVEEETSDLTSVEDEPLEPDRLAHVIMAGELFSRIVGMEADRRSHDEVDAVVAAYADLKELEGALPAGLFGRAQRSRLSLEVRALVQAFSMLQIDEPLGPLRFGRAEEGAPVSTIHPPLELALTGPDGSPLEVVVHGRTQLLDDGRTRSVRALLRDCKGDSDHLPAFLDHMVLAATGLGCGGALESVLVAPGKLRTKTFEPVTAGAARSYLASLLSEMLLSSHDYFLPIEAVDLYYASADRADLRACCEEVRQDDRRSLVSDRGPVAHSRGYDSPAEELALAIVARRLVPFYGPLPSRTRVPPAGPAGSGAP